MKTPLRQLFLLGAWSFLTCIQTIAQEDMGNQETHTFQARGEQVLELQYLLYVPAALNTREKLPVLLFLHGAGERGTNISKVTVHGPPKLIKQKRDFPFIVISPQCPADQIWQPFALLQLLQAVLQEHNGDPERVYLTGLSMGGFGTWDLGLQYPDRFAAIAPICGGGNILHVLLAPRNKVAALKTLPVWAFHGAKDEVVKLGESERMIQALKRVGNEPKFTVYPHAGHDSWTETYQDQGLYDWFLQHRRPGAGKLWQPKEE